MFRSIIETVKKHERHLTALAMLTGFVVDSIFFERVDLWQTQVVFATYTVVCFVSILLLHRIEFRARTGAPRGFLRFVLPLFIQFSLGGFWSGFVIFYGRSAVLGASWPFLLFLVLVFIGSEYFQRYHDRLVFTTVLFFFALYSYAIFAVPVYTGTIGTLTFLASGAIAVLFFALFTILLRLLGRERFLEDVWRIRAGAILVLAVVNISYFTNILPPLPLSAEAAGVYHGVSRTPDGYVAYDESQRWPVRYLGFAPTLHVLQGGSVAAYTAVFAPTTLSTTITHEWERFDERTSGWKEVSTVRYSIVGGRDGGYRGYSSVPMTFSGEWRVTVRTSDGRIIARTPFTVEFASSEPELETIVLK